MSKYNNELHKHKAADTIKWIVAFVLIFALIGAIVSIGLRFGGVFGNGGEKAPAEHTPTPDPDITDDPPIDMTDYSIQPGQYYEKIYVTPDSAALDDYLFSISSSGISDNFQAGFIIADKDFKYDPWTFFSGFTEFEDSIKMIVMLDYSASDIMGGSYLCAMTKDEDMLIYYADAYYADESEDGGLVFPGYNNVDEDGALLDMYDEPVSGVVIPLYFVTGDFDKIGRYYDFAKAHFKDDFDRCFSSKSFGDFGKVDHYTGEPLQEGYNRYLFMNTNMEAWREFYEYAETNGKVDSGYFELFNGKYFNGRGYLEDISVKASALSHGEDDKPLRYIEIELFTNGSATGCKTHICPYGMPPEEYGWELNDFDVNGFFNWGTDESQGYFFDSTLLPIELFNKLFATTPFSEYYHEGLYFDYTEDRSSSSYDFGLTDEPWMLVGRKLPKWLNETVDMTQYRYELKWRPDNNEWARDKNPEDYLDLQVTADKVTVTCKQPFAEIIRICVYDGEELVFGDSMGYSFEYTGHYVVNYDEFLIVDGGTLRINQERSSDVYTRFSYDGCSRFSYSWNNPFVEFGGSFRGGIAETVNGYIDIAVHFGDIERLLLEGDNLIIGGDEGVSAAELATMDSNNTDVETIKQGLADASHEAGEQLYAGTLSYQDSNGRSHTINVYIKLSETFYEI